MNYLILSAILFGYIRGQTTEFIPNVPDYVAEIFAVIGTSCVTDTECEEKYNGPTTYTNSDNAVWTCMNDTVTNDNGDSKDISVCVFDGCDSIGDCDGGICKDFGTCNPDSNVFYPDEMMLGSKMCIDTVACATDGAPPNAFRQAGDYSNETMCYTGDDSETYVSEEYAVICAGTCIVDADLCIDALPMTSNSAANCVDDETCCSKDEWDEEGCLELLITTYLMYTIIVAVVLCLCCVGCCCCIYKKKKNKASFEDNMDNQTNHYNVYI